MADLQATLKTNKGDITVNLFPNHAPETVANFTGLKLGALKPVLAEMEQLDRDLLDLPGSPLPDPDTPAPVRFLPVWDATLLVHARRTGVLPEDLRLFDRLTGAELLTYNGLLRAMPAPVVAARSRELLEVLGLADAAGTLVVDYSHGMRKKIALAAALLHAPRILFLDEPFEAIDPVSARTIRGLLERYTAGGATVVFSSHVMELVERLCDRVGIMHLGRLIAEGPTDQVRAGRSLEDAFVELVGAGDAGAEELGWLGTWSA